MLIGWHLKLILGLPLLLLTDFGKKFSVLALIEPLDNMFDDTMATHPELQLHLEKVMVALNYDLKEFLRILYNTQAFQRISIS